MMTVEQILTYRMPLLNGHSRPVLPSPLKVYSMVMVQEMYAPKPVVPTPGVGSGPSTQNSRVIPVPTGSRAITR